MPLPEQLVTAKSAKLTAVNANASQMSSDAIAQDVKLVITTGQIAENAIVSETRSATRALANVSAQRIHLKIASAARLMLTDTIISLVILSIKKLFSKQFFQAASFATATLKEPSALLKAAMTTTANAPAYPSSLVKVVIDASLVTTDSLTVKSASAMSAAQSATTTSAMSKLALASAKKMSKAPAALAAKPVLSSSILRIQLAAFPATALV